MLTQLRRSPERVSRRTSRTVLRLEQLEERRVLSGDVIYQWNQAVDIALGAGVQSGTILIHRTYAMVHVAMFDAVDAITQQYTHFFAYAQAPANASPEAAAAQAAFDVLVRLYPTLRSSFNSVLADSLQGIPPDQAAAGRSVGSTVAEQILAWRAGDRWDLPLPSYNPGYGPGIWEPLPPFNGAAFTNAPTVVPFAVQDGFQFTPAPPPDLLSPEYTAAYNEVQSLGRIDSTTRTADQTLVAQLWASVGTFTTDLDIWNQAAENVANGANLSLTDRARVFALLNVSAIDSLQTSFAAKYSYGFWRPLSAIPRAAETGNPDTVPDPTWTPLLNTPPFPSYASNHSAVAGSSSTILASVFGTDSIPFSVTWDTVDVTRSYPGFSAMAQEDGMSRIWGGIHFQFDNTTGLGLGTNVANYLFQNFMLPLNRPSGSASGSGHHSSLVDGQVPDSWRQLVGAVTSTTSTSLASSSIPSSSRISPVTPASGAAAGQSVAVVDVLDGRGDQHGGAVLVESAGGSARHTTNPDPFASTSEEDLFANLDWS